MKLAETITITVVGEEIILHPALRHAIRLERREGSFRQLVADINEGSLTAALDIIAAHTDLANLSSRVFDVLPQLKPALLAYVAACAGVDPSDKPSDDKPKATAKSVPFSEHLLHLYRVGTGWMGWTPADTLDATPAEIMEAYKGRLVMLKAIFGSGEKAEPVKDDRPLEAKFRSIFAGHQVIREEA